VRSALLEVKGVSRAVVSLENHEAIVTFDPRLTTSQKLIEAVNKAQGPSDSITYSASVKPAPAR
jgi:copper chaperone CopZ